MYPVEFKVKFWDDIAGKEETSHGVTIAENWAEAMTNIESYFGSDLISAQLFMLDEGSCYIFEDSNNELFHGMFRFRSIETYSGY